MIAKIPQTINRVAVKKFCRPREGVAEFPHPPSATPERKIEASPAALLFKARHHRKILFSLEHLGDGRKVVITKPGGKFTFGTIKREDFMVWIYSPAEKSLWLISHRNIYEDLMQKGEEDPEATTALINALERVYKGDDPDAVLSSVQFPHLTDEPPEVLLKAYKWIWGQEDVNYPDGKGRAMSWEGWEKGEHGWQKTSKGIADLRDSLQRKAKNR